MTDQKHPSNTLDQIRADNAGLAIVISNASLPDCPIIYCSPEFELHSGYSIDEVVGRNCRLMQGPDTEAEARAKFRKAIETGEDDLIEVTNYRKDGTKFKNSVLLRTILSDNQADRLMVAVQNVVDRQAQSDGPLS